MSSANGEVEMSVNGVSQTAPTVSYFASIVSGPSITVTSWTRRPPSDQDRKVQVVVPTLTHCLAAMPTDPPTIAVSAGGGVPLVVPTVSVAAWRLACTAARPGVGWGAM